MKAPVLVTLVIGLHILVVGLIMLAQGCRTTAPVQQVEEPPPPVMPPRATQVPPVEPARPPLLPPAGPRPAPPPSLPEMGTYTVRRGDSLSGIAQRLGVSARELAELNALTDPNRIVEGQALLVPGYSGEIQPPPRPEPAPERTPRPPEGPGTDYVVQTGDTLTGIAQRFGVRWRDVASANNLAEPYRIRVGQKLRIPGAEASPERPAPQPPTPAPAPPVTEPAPPVEEPRAPELGADEPFPYRVAEGETLETIAQFFLVSVDELMRLNEIADPAAVRPGQQILIPLPRSE